MGVLTDLIWGKGTTARCERLAALIPEAEAVRAPSEVLTYLRYGRGEKAIETLIATPSLGEFHDLIAKISAAQA